MAGARKVRHLVSDLRYTSHTPGFLCPEATCHCDRNRHDIHPLPDGQSEDHMRPEYFVLAASVVKLIVYHHPIDYILGVACR